MKEPISKDEISPKSIIVNQIISDTLDELKNIFKPRLSREEILGSRWVDFRIDKLADKPAGLAEVLGERKALKDEYNKVVEDERRADASGKRPGTNLMALVLAPLLARKEAIKKFALAVEESGYEQKANEFLKNYKPFEGTPLKEVNDLFVKMEARAGDNDISLAALQEAIAVHAEKNFAKFSDAAAMRKK